MTSLLRRWPRRRRRAALLLVPPLGLLFAAASTPAGGAGRGVAAWVLLALVTAAAAGTLASYVPARGLRPDLGCSPCAAVSAFTVVAAYLLMRNAATDPSAAVLAAGVVLFGLGQRLSAPATCEVRPGQGPTGAAEDRAASLR